MREINGDLTGEELDAARTACGIMHDIRDRYEKEVADRTRSHILTPKNLRAWARSLCFAVETREAWTAAGSQADPGEYRLLLAGGGPTVWIRGELDGDYHPERDAFMRVYDQGREVKHPATWEERDYAALRWFAGLFNYRTGNVRI